MMSNTMLWERHRTKKETQNQSAQILCPVTKHQGLLWRNSLLKKKKRKRLKNVLNFQPSEWETNKECQEQFQEIETTLSNSFYASLSPVKNKIF